jgi:N6-adenosine-specific RNA methylase IME4
MNISGKMDIQGSFPGLRARSFGAIVIDPPWPYDTYSAKGEGRSAKRHYPTMSLAEIKALPIAAHAAHDCWLFSWCPAPSTKFLIEVMDAWGFKFSGLGFSWVKVTRNAGLTPLSVTAAPGAMSPWHMGLGHSTRANVELCWLGSRGQPHRLDKGVRELIVAPVREHSRKPDEIYDRIERFCAGPYLELFARQRWPRWSSWGNQIEKFRIGDVA